MLTTNARHGVRLPDEPFTRQEPAMPRGKKIADIRIRIDQEFINALSLLQDIYPDVTKSELIRSAVIEKAQRDAKRRRHDNP
jgi:hypothetical protein